MTLLRRLLPLVLLSQVAVAGEARSLLENGDFATLDGGGAPAGWGLADGVTWGVEPANHYLHFTAPGGGKDAMLYRLVPLGDAKAVRFACRVRWAGVERGDEGWHDARVILDFKDAKGGTVGPGPGHPNFTGTSDGWQAVERVARVPDGAVALAVMPGLFHAKAGTFDVDHLSITAIAPDAVPVAAAAPAIAVDGGKPPPRRLHVDGPKVLDPDGHEVWLQGVNVPSLGWSNTGDGVALASVVAAVERWHANVVRLAVDRERWAGTAKPKEGSGDPYRALVDQAIAAANSRGAYVILDLHGYRAPRAEDVAFWSDAAKRYADRPGVLYGLLNEPYDISWEVWRDGGKVEEKRKDDAAQGVDAAKTTSFQSPGLQKVIDAVRATGARNLVVVGGLDWAYDLSGVLNGFALDQRGGDGLIYDSHVYYWKSNWQRGFLDVAAKHPVLLGEVGCETKNFDFIPAERFEDPYTWAPDMIGCIQRHHLHWTAWSLHPGANPALISDLATFAPTPHWGAFVKAALSGARFEPVRLR